METTAGDNEAAHALAALLAAVGSHGPHPSSRDPASSKSKQTTTNANATSSSTGSDSRSLMSSLPIEEDMDTRTMRAASESSFASSSHLLNGLNYTPQPTRSGRMPQKPDPREADNFTMLFHEFLNSVSSDEDDDPDYDEENATMTLNFDSNNLLSGNTAVRRSPRKNKGTSVTSDSRKNKRRKKKKSSEDDESGEPFEDDDDDDHDDDEDEGDETDFSFIGDGDPYPEFTAFMSDHPSVSSMSSAVPTPDTLGVPTPGSAFAPSPNYSSIPVRQQHQQPAQSHQQPAAAVAPTEPQLQQSPPKRKRGRPRKDEQRQTYAPSLSSSSMPPPPVPVRPPQQHPERQQNLLFPNDQQQQRQFQQPPPQPPASSSDDPRAARKLAQKEASANYRRQKKEQAEADARRVIELERENAVLKERVWQLERALNGTTSASHGSVASTSSRRDPQQPFAPSHHQQHSAQQQQHHNNQNVNDHRGGQTGSSDPNSVLNSLMTNFDKTQIDSLSKLLQLVAASK